MQSAKDFFRPLAVGAPSPVHEVPFRPSRMIHFFPPSNEKMLAKAPAMAEKVDILLANLEDGVPADEKEAARAGMVEVNNRWEYLKLSKAEGWKQPKDHPDISPAHEAAAMKSSRLMSACTKLRRV